MKPNWLMKWFLHVSEIRIPKVRPLLRLACLGTWACLSAACHKMPEPVPSSVMPSPREAEVGKNLIGKSFITIEEAYLYPGVFPSLTRRSPNEFSKAIPLPVGTRLIVKRIELEQGKVGNAVLELGALVGAIQAGVHEDISDIVDPLHPETADVLYVDLYLESKAYRNVQMDMRLSLDGGPPRIRPARFSQLQTEQHDRRSD